MIIWVSTHICAHKANSAPWLHACGTNRLPSSDVWRFPARRCVQNSRNNEKCHRRRIDQADGPETTDLNRCSRFSLVVREGQTGLQRECHAPKGRGCGCLHARGPIDRDVQFGELLNVLIQKDGAGSCRNGETSGARDDCACQRPEFIELSPRALRR